MTDHSKWTDEQINEAIGLLNGYAIGEHHYGTQVVKEFKDPFGRIGAYPDEFPDYIHNWLLCGKLIEEMGDAIKDGWEFSCEHNNCDGFDPLKWRVWMMRFTNDEKDFRCYSSESDNFRRAICEAFLTWKEQK